MSTKRIVNLAGLGVFLFVSSFVFAHSISEDIIVRDGIIMKDTCTTVTGMNGTNRCEEENGFCTSYIFLGRIGDDKVSADDLYRYKAVQGICKTTPSFSGPGWCRCEILPKNDRAVN